MKFFPILSLTFFSVFWVYPLMVLLLHKICGMLDSWQSNYHYPTIADVPFANDVRENIGVDYFVLILVPNLMLVCLDILLFTYPTKTGVFFAVTAVSILGFFHYKAHIKKAKPWRYDNLSQTKNELNK